MEITVNVNIPALNKFVELMEKAAIAQLAGKTTPGAVAASAQPEAAAESKKAVAETGKKGRAAAPAPAANTAPAAAAEASPLTRDEVKARLSDYSADKRYGMDAVFALLKKYGVQRISDLPEAQFVPFKKEIDDALAKPAADPLS